MFFFTQHKFEYSVFLRLLACHVAVGNNPISTVEDWHFRQILLYLKPDLNLPGRHGLREVILNEYKAEKERMISFFEMQPNLKVSICKLLIKLQFNEIIIKLFAID